MRLTPDLLLKAYAMGVFPMAPTRSSTEIRWIDPLRRAHLPLDGFHLSRSLARAIRRDPPRVTVDQAFTQVVEACADREETWINAEIFAAYRQLFHLGHAHSLEIWSGESLVGGVYGVVLGAAFFGESMFSRQTDASKMALAYLVHRLRAGGFTLFDVQFVTPHLQSLGVVEVSRGDYQRLLRQALAREAAFDPPDYRATPQAVIEQTGLRREGLPQAGLQPGGKSQPNTQTS